MSSSSSNSSATTDQITMSQHSTVLAPSNHLQIKLTNYLSWKTAGIPYINGNKISHHINGIVTPSPQFIASSSSTTILVPNSANASWFENDQLLLGVLMSTISENLISHLVGQTSAHAVWVTLEKLFSSQS